MVEGGLQRGQPPFPDGNGGASWAAAPALWEARPQPSPLPKGGGFWGQPGVREGTSATVSRGTDQGGPGRGRSIPPPDCPSYLHLRGMDVMGWESCATLRAVIGPARPPHARGRRGRSGAAEPPVGGSLHLPLLLVPACPPGSGPYVRGVRWGGSRGCRCCFG